MTSLTMGPNVRRLIIRKMSMDAIPDGGGIAAGIEFLATPGRAAEGWRKATLWVGQAILALRTAVPPNPWKDATEEEIAGELLRLAEERDRAQAAGVPEVKTP